LLGDHASNETIDVFYINTEEEAKKSTESKPQPIFISGVKYKKL